MGGSVRGLRPSSTWSVRHAENCMNTARLATKYEMTAHLPPTILVALAAPSADLDVVEGVVDNIKAGKAVTNVKERLAEARAAKLKAKAFAKKSPEQIAKEQKAEAKRQASVKKRIREHEEEQAAIEAGEVEVAEKALRLLVAGLGAGRTLELFTLMRGISFYRVEQLFRPWVDGQRTTLTEQDIKERFGGAK